MQSEFQEHHFDYVLTVPSLVAGKRLTVPLRLDPDAPFELRGRAMRIPYDTGSRGDQGTQTGIEQVWMRFTDENGTYIQQDLVPQALDMAYWGQGGNPKPVYPPIRYPARGVIAVDLYNAGTTDLTNVTMYFRGVKLFQWGQRPHHTFPLKFTPLPFTYPQLFLSLPLTTPTMGTRQMFTCRADADFVLRALQAGVNSATRVWYEVFLTLRDDDLYPYSNAPVHVDVLCGNGFTGNVFPCPAGTFVAPVGPGPESPGLLFPEIYVPANHVLYYDILRTDASYAGIGAAVCDFPIPFLGMKVFSRV